MRKVHVTHYELLTSTNISSILQLFMMLMVCVLCVYVLSSINYHHCGASKTWYGVPGHAASAFEEVVQTSVYDADMLSEDGVGAAYDLLIGKTTMFPPKLLSQRKVPVYRAVQAPGEFVITFPRAYHAGFSHGFNCGEAVNFAMADWLQFGGAASKRYELLNRPPLLPHEELLCKEAMYLAVDNNKRRRGCADNNNCVPKKLASEQQRAVKVAFVRLMRFQHQVRWLLKKWGSRTIFTSPGFDTSVSCGLCKHMCYVAFVSCRCNTEEDWICLNHAQENRKCTCGVLRAVVVREGLLEMEAAAHAFEREDDGSILEEALKDPSIQDGTCMSEDGLEEHMLDCDDYNGYKPYGDHHLPVERVESPSTNSPSHVLCADDADKGTNVANKCVPTKLKRPVKIEDNDSVCGTTINGMTHTNAGTVLPQVHSEDAAGEPSVTDDAKEMIVRMQSLETAQSQAMAAAVSILGEPSSNTAAYRLSSGKQHISRVMMPGQKRKRSGLVTRTMPAVDKMQTTTTTTQSKDSPSKVLSNSSICTSSPCTSSEVEDDYSLHMKRQRMASLGKIRFEGGKKVVAQSKPQEMMTAHVTVSLSYPPYFGCL
jgi:hypothetical protein